MLRGLIKRESRDIGDSIGLPTYFEFWNRFGYNGIEYQIPAGSMTQLTALQAIKNPILLAAIMIRCSTFSQIRFQFRNRLMSPKSTGSREARREAIEHRAATRYLFGTQALSILENPWHGASTNDLLAMMELNVAMYGNSYWTEVIPGELTWLDPNHMKILTADVIGPRGGIVGQTLVGYQIHDKSGHAVESFLPNEILHYRPYPDPSHPYRGLSWLAAALGEVSTDDDIATFKRGFLRNSATPNLVATVPADISDDNFKLFQEMVESRHTSPSNAFKTLYVSAGVDVKAVGNSWSDMQLFATQSYGDTRLAVISGVPASLLGIAEGLKGSALNAGNYAAVRRRFADITIRPLWDNLMGAASVMVPPPPGSQLWYDDRDVQFLQVDLQDSAQVRQLDATTMMTLANAGWTRDSIVEAVMTNDWSGLEEDPDAMSVQLQPLVAPAAPVDPNQGKPVPDDDEGSDDDETNSRLLRLEQREPVSVTVNQAPITVQAPDVIITTPEVTVTPAALTSRETTFVKDDDGEIIGAREVVTATAAKATTSVRTHREKRITHNADGEVVGSTERESE